MSHIPCAKRLPMATTRKSAEWPQQVVPVAVMLAAFILLWYAGAWVMNASAAIQLSGTVDSNAATTQELVRTAEGLSALMERFKT